MYTIKDMTIKFKLPASTIRYYENIGLLENVERINGYRREYNESHVDRINAIECFKKARLSLEDIKKFFEYEKDIKGSSKKILEMMKKQEDKTVEEMQNLQDGIAHIQKKIRYYSLVNQAVTEGNEIPKWSDVFTEW